MSGGWLGLSVSECIKNGSGVPHSLGCARDGLFSRALGERGAPSAPATASLYAHVSLLSTPIQPPLRPRLHRLLKKSNPHIPRGLKPARDEKCKGLSTAQLKLRPVKTGVPRVFQRPVRSRNDESCSTPSLPVSPPIPLSTSCASAPRFRGFHETRVAALRLGLFFHMSGA